MCNNSKKGDKSCIEDFEKKSVKGRYSFTGHLITIGI